MIKHIERLLFLLLPAMAFTACTEDEGTEPGNDGAPNLSIFEQSTTTPNDPDVDGTYRIATNNKTEQVYYLAESTASAGTDDAYAQKVVSQGTQLTLGTDTVSGGKVADVVVKNMVGDYTVSFVAVNGNKRTLRQTTFFGLTWNDVATGTYNFNAYSQNYMTGEASVTTTLQQLSTDPTRYRFHNIYGTGYNLVFTKTDVTGSDEDGTYNFIRVNANTTPYTYGSYGSILVRDVGYFQNDDSYAYDSGWGCYMYENNTVRLVLEHYVSGGYLWYNRVDWFIPSSN